MHFWLLSPPMAHCNLAVAAYLPLLRGRDLPLRLGERPVMPLPVSGPVLGAGAETPI